MKCKTSVLDLHASQTLSSGKLINGNTRRIKCTRKLRCLMLKRVSVSGSYSGTMRIWARKGCENEKNVCERWNEILLIS